MWSPWDKSFIRRNKNYSSNDYTPNLKKKKMNELDLKNNQRHNNNELRSFTQNDPVSTSFSNNNNLFQKNIFQKQHVSFNSKQTPFITSFRSFNSSNNKNFYTTHVNFNNYLSTKPINNFDEPIFDSSSLIGILFFYKNYKYKKKN